MGKRERHKGAEKLKGIQLTHLDGGKTQNHFMTRFWAPDYSLYNGYLWMLIRKFVIYVWNVTLGVFSHMLTFSHQHLLSCSSPGLRSYPFYSSSVSTPFSSITYLIPDQVSTVPCHHCYTTHPYQHLLFLRAQKSFCLRNFNGFPFLLENLHLGSLHR